MIWAYPPTPMISTVLFANLYSLFILQEEAAKQEERIQAERRRLQELRNAAPPADTCILL